MLKDTVTMSLTATMIIVVFSLILGNQIYFKKRFRYLDYILVIPFILPGIVLSVGVLSAYAGLFSAETIPFRFISFYCSP